MNGKVSNNRAIAIAKYELNKIIEYKSYIRREYVKDFMQSRTKSWQSLWKYLGFKKPTKKMALHNYYYERIGFFPSKFAQVCFVFSGRQNKFEDMLKAARGQ